MDNCTIEKILNFRNSTQFVWFTMIFFFKLNKKDETNEFKTTRHQRKNFSICTTNF